MFKSTLTSEETGNFQKIHNTLIPKRKKQYETFQIFNATSRVAGKKKENYTLTKPVLDKAISVLKQNNITDFDAKFYSLEFHQRNCGFEKKPYQLFSWHQDDGGATSYRVHTVIFYIRKDIAVKDGNLEYKIGKDKFTHIVKEADILSFKGDIQHKPQPTSGFGCRDIIVCFIKRTGK